MRGGPLGDVDFDDWYEVPVFDADSDERLEHAASSGNGALRFAATAILTAEARSSRLLRRRSNAEETTSDPLADFYAGRDAGDGSWRSRATAVIDRWAEREVERGLRLERSLRGLHPAKIAQSLRAGRAN